MHYLRPCLYSSYRKRLHDNLYSEIFKTLPQSRFKGKCRKLGEAKKKKVIKRFKKKWEISTDVSVPDCKDNESVQRHSPVLLSGEELQYDTDCASDSSKQGQRTCVADTDSFLIVL